MSLSLTVAVGNVANFGIVSNAAFEPLCAVPIAAVGFKCMKPNGGCGFACTYNCSVIANTCTQTPPNFLL